jgi:hypothetical protein
LLNKFSRFLEKSETVKPEDKIFSIRYVIIISVLAGIIVQILCYIFDYNFAYRDSIFRLEAARRFFDSTNPGIITQIGTVWLPIPNFIVMPFAYIDFLWQTGLAGCIVNFFAFIISAAALFSLLKHTTRNFLASWFGYLLFISNFNILYFQTTTMTESLYICFIVLFVFYLFKWEIYEKTKFLFYSSIFSFLAVGSRYDAWPLVAVASLIVFIVSFQKKQKVFKNIFVYSFIPVVAIIIWFLYNWLYFGDALEFSRGRFSTLHQLKYYEDAGRLLTKNNIWLSLKVSVSSSVYYSGFLFFILAFIGFLFYLRKNKLYFRTFLPYLFIISLPVCFILLYLGQLIIELPNSEPPGFFNSRYGLYIFPGVCFFTAYLVKYISEKLKINLKVKLYYLLVLVFFSQMIISLSYFPYNISGIEEAKYNFSKASEDVSLFLKDNYDGGCLLYDNVIFAIYPWTKINLKDRITFHTYDIGEKAMKNPEKYAKWVMYYTIAPNDHIYNSLKENKSFKEYYESVFNEEGIEIYKRKF